MKLDTATRARFALLGLLVAFLVGISLIYDFRLPGNGRGVAEPPQNLQNPLDRTPPSSDVYTLQQFTRLLDRRPTAAEFRNVLGAVDDANWAVTHTALRVLRSHQHAQLNAAQVRVLRRCVELPADQPLAALPYLEWQECVAAIHEILDELPATAPAGELAERGMLLAELARRGPDGQSRARALTILANGPWRIGQRPVLLALEDPSEQVRLAALEIVAANHWTAAAPQLEQLVSSPRPNLRHRAARVLESLGQPSAAREYGECVRSATNRLAEQLERAGFDPLGSVTNTPASNGTIDVEELRQRAEAYLDAAPELASSPDYQGVLLLAAAAGAGQRKLALRLWELEVTRADSDDEMFDHGLQAVAQSQLLAGLAALQHGDRSTGLQEFASVARLAPFATSCSRVQVYVSHAGQLSAAIWQGTVADSNGSHSSPAPADSVAQLAGRLLEKLDLEQPAHHEQARCRLDAWCGLDAAPSTTSGRHHPAAN